MYKNYYKIKPSYLLQAMISGVKAQMNNISQLIEFEKEGMGALKAQEYPKAIEFLDKSLELAGSCLRLKMARGDCLAHLGRYVPFIFVILHF